MVNGQDDSDAKTSSPEPPSPTPKRRRQSTYVPPTAPFLSGYGRWLDPEYPFYLLPHYRPRPPKTFSIPKGLEVIACFDEGSLRVLYVSVASYGALEDQTRKRLKSENIDPERDDKVMLEEALHQHNQRQVYHANPTEGVVDIFHRERYRVMPMVSVVDHISSLSREQLRLGHATEFEDHLRQELGIRLFHLRGSQRYYTAVQAEIVQRGFFPNQTIYKPLTDLTFGIKDEPPTEKRVAKSK